MSVTFEVSCDRCGLSGGTQKRGTARTLRARLRAAGWSTGREGGQDFCPSCHAPAPKGSS